MCLLHTCCRGTAGSTGHPAMRAAAGAATPVKGKTRYPNIYCGSLTKRALCAVTRVSRSRALPAVSPVSSRGHIGHLLQYPPWSLGLCCFFLLLYSEVPSSVFSGLISESPVRGSAPAWAASPGTSPPAPAHPRHPARPNANRSKLIAIVSVGRASSFT